MPDMVLITDERCMGYRRAGHPERPERIGRTLARLREQKEVTVEWREPLPVNEALLLRAHTRHHLERIREALHDFDMDTPAFPDIYDHACRSVGGALRALHAAREGKLPFSLLRPPGHHATRDRAMGFCYLNAIATVALEAVTASDEKVAVFDFDVHHGNGSEAILLNQGRTAYFSVHQHPCYPGTGTENEGENCFNFPVPPQTPRLEYRKVLGKALAELAKFKPSLVAVSAGFDAYLHDPIAQEALETEDFYWLGQEIRKLGLPVLSVLEGGYSSDLPELVLAYLKGLAGK